ncbi:MAG: hypothetical protein R2809_09985 [Flavobacteriales bacterium]
MKPTSEYQFEVPIQQLHIDLNNTKENSVTYEDRRRNWLIADEAHHLVAGKNRVIYLVVGKRQ